MFSREMPALRRDLERAGEEGGDVLHDVDAGIGAVAVVHDDDGRNGAPPPARPCRGRAAGPRRRWRWRRPRRAPRRRPRISCCRWRRERRARRRRPSTGCSRRSSSSAETGCAPIGPGGFRADVDDVGALGDHAPGLRQRALRRDELPAIGKGIRRDVQHAHHGRIRPGQQRRAAPDDLPGRPQGRVWTWSRSCGRFARSAHGSQDAADAAAAERRAGLADP